MRGQDSAVTRRYWLVPVLRGLAALALAGFVTFTPDHSPVIGLAAFGFLAVASGTVLVLGTRTMVPGIARSCFLVQGVLTVLAGAAALAFREGGLALLLLLLSGFAVITGTLELCCGFSQRKRSASSLDWTVGGILTVLLGVAILLVPPGMREQFTGPDGIARELTPSVVVVGMLGAYGAVLGVYLLIGGLSLKWAPATELRAAERGT